jgi:hypothetical protein
MITFNGISSGAVAAAHRTCASGLFQSEKTKLDFAAKPL